MKTAKVMLLAALAAPLAAGSAIAQRQPAPTESRVAALKANLAASQANLRQYEWVQTTVVKVNGKEASRKQERCYYGADGALQKLPISAKTPKKKPGLRGKLQAKKAGEMTDYMKKAVTLVSSYVPPDPKRLQTAANLGMVSMDILEPGKRVRLNFKDYLKPGDSFGVEIGMANNVPLGMTLSSYLGKPEDAVAMAVAMGKLNDGTIYPANVTLDAPAKGVHVTVQNTGYLKLKRAGGP